MQSNLWHHKFFHFHLPFWNWKVWKGRGKNRKIVFLTKWYQKIFPLGKMHYFLKALTFFFLSGFSFYRHWPLTGQQGKGGTIFYSTLPLPTTHEHSDIDLQLCISDEYHIFLIMPLVFTRLLVDKIYQLIKLSFNWLMMWN